MLDNRGVEVGAIPRGSLGGILMASITVYDGANTIGGNKIYMEEKGLLSVADKGRRSRVALTERGRNTLYLNGWSGTPGAGTIR
jgi:hypothetical protein